VSVTPRGGRRSALAAGLGLLGVLLLAAPAAASTVHQAPPLGEYAETLRFTVTSISPSVVTAPGPEVLTVRGRVTNTSDTAVEDLEYRFQRGDAVADADAVDKALSDPGQPIAVIQPTFTELSAHLDAKASTPFTATVPISGSNTTGLAVTAPGVYPVMLNVNGDLGGDQGRARVGELHLLLTVLGVPGTAGPAADDALSPIGVGLFWPLTSTPHLGVGGVFLNEDLAADIGPQGRLSVLLRQLSRLPSPRSFTVVIDPALLDELDRMAGGYRVTADPGVPQPALRPPAATTATPETGAAGGSSGSARTESAANPSDSSSANSTPGPSGSRTTSTPETGATTSAGGPTLASADANTVAGTGVQAAADYLDELRTELARHQVVVLPYGNVDAVALVRQGMTGQLRSAVRSGAEVASRVLTGIRYETAVAVPPDGALDEPTAAALTADGYQTLVLAGGSVDAAEPAGAVKIQLSSGASTTTVPALVADSPVLPTMHALIAGTRGSTIATRLNALAAELGQRAIDGDGDPVVYLIATADRRPHPAGTAAVAGLLATMTTSGGAAPIDAATTAATATEDGTLDYPVSPADELPAGYLGRWQQANHQITGMAATLVKAEVADSPDPAVITDELAASTQNLGSASLRPDQQPGNLVLATIESTLQSLRNQVTIRSSAGSYTLASQSSPLVLTLKNDLPYVVRVRVQITGAARAGLTVEDPGVIELAARRTQLVRIPATVSRAGTFTVRAQLVGADGSVWGQPVELTIKSTAYGVLTVVLIAVAGAVLLLMVIIRIVQRVRGRGEEKKGSLDGTTTGPAPDSIIAAANDPLDDAPGPPQPATVPSAPSGPDDRSPTPTEGDR
jgi:hypothetical protein